MTDLGTRADGAPLLRSRLAAPVCLGLTGIGVAAAFPPLDFGFLAWVVLVPTFLWAIGRRTRAVLAFGLVLGLLIFGAGLAWLAVLTPGGLVVLASILAPYTMVAVALARRLLGAGPLAGPLAGAAAWTAIDLLRATLLSGFPWLFLGHTQHRTLAVAQIADVGGVYAVTFLVVWVNLAIVGAVADRRRGGDGGKRRLALRLGPPAAAVAVALGYGAVRLAAPADPPGPCLAGIQANIPVSLKHDPMSGEEILDEHLRWTEEALRRGRPDLVIWSETMFPWTWDENIPGALEENRRLVRALVGGRVRVPMLLGVTWVEKGDPDPRSLEHRRRNRALLVDRDGREIGAYDKIHLVPLGEFLPLRRRLPARRAIEDLVYRVGGWYPTLTPGERSPCLSLPLEGREPMPFGAMICYDSVFPDVARRAAREGARFLVNLSNDGWYGRSSELDQILAITVFRAIETRLAVFRVTNTGISAAVDSRGRIRDRVRGRDREGVEGEKEVAGVLVREVGLGSGTSAYVALGDLFAMVCAAGAAAALLRRCKD